MSRTWLAVFVGLALALVCGTARAAQPSPKAKHAVLLLPLEAEGLLPADREALDQRLRPAFEHPDIELLAPDELATCADEACLRELGREHGASHVVRTHVLADGRDYVAQLEVLTVDGELPLSTIDASCEICGLAEFDDRLAARAVAGRELIHVEPQVGRLELVGQPHDARVRIDGTWRGQLPFSGELGVGPHELIVASGGHFRQVIPIETVGGVGQRLKVALEPKPIRQWHRSVGWTSLGIGIGSLATGTILLGVHGQPAALRCRTDDPTIVDDEGDCGWLRQTLGPGVGLTIAGIAAATTGVTLLVIDTTRRRAHARTSTSTSDIKVGALLGLNRVGLWIRF
jgi:hypothetical protein